MTEEKCPWAYRTELEMTYHDEDWGYPLHDDKKLFEMLSLETMQAGLSWSTVLAKRDDMTKAFDYFDPNILKDYSEEKIESLLTNPGIIRNKLKVRSVVSNASAFLKIQDEFGTFDSFIWAYVSNKPIENRWKSIEEVPNFTPIAEQLSKDLKKRGFKFIGPTTVYAFMQSIGMVNDHLISCPIHKKTGTHTS